MLGTQSGTAPSRENHGGDRTYHHRLAAISVRRLPQTGESSAAGAEVKSLAR